MLAVWWGNADPSARLPTAIYVLLHVQLLSSYAVSWHLPERWSVIFRESLLLLLVVVIATAIQFLLAFVFFPWTAHKELVQKLALTLSYSSKLLLRLELSSGEDLSKGGSSHGGTRRKELREKMESARRAALDLVKPSYYELRWCFNGRGTHLWNFYKACRPTTRFVLHAAIGLDMANATSSDHTGSLPSLQLRSQVQELAALERDLARILQRLADGLRSLDAAECAEVDVVKEELSQRVDKLQTELLALAKREFEVHGGRHIDSVASKALQRSITLKNMIDSLHGVSNALTELCLPANEWTVIDWAPTLPSICLRRYTMRTHPIDPTPMWKQEFREGDFIDLFDISCERRALKILEDDDFRTGVKAAFGATILLLCGLLIPELLQLSLANAIASLLSALRVIHLGLAYERAFLRIFGVGLGYLLAGIVFSICGTALQGFAIVLLSIPLCGLLMLAMSRWSKFNYMIYSSLKDFLVITLLHYLRASSPGDTQSIWEYGGFIALFSLLGVVLGVLLQGLCFPVTGEKALRTLMSQSLLNMDLALEMYVFSTHAARDLDIRRQIDHKEYDTAYLLFMKAPGLLKSLRYDDPIPQTNHHSLYYRYERLKAKREDYSAAIEHLRNIYHALWIYRRFRGSLPFLLGEEWKELIHPSTMQSILARKRLMPATFVLLANALRNTMPLPFLKPLLASPAIFLPFLRINQQSLFADRAVVAIILATDDPAIFVATTTTNTALITVSQSLGPLYDFVQTTSHQLPLYSNGIRDRAGDLAEVLDTSETLPFLTRRASF